MTTSRPTALLLAVLACVAGASACGGSRPERSAGTDPPTHTEAHGTRGTRGDEYPGVFASAREVCGSVPQARVAANVHSKSTAPQAVAHAFASGYKPQLRGRAYRGCLAGLR
jgi:hypothetical protein